MTNTKIYSLRAECFSIYFIIMFFFFFLPPVPLGSIPELPANSCTEIKASEGGKVVSGKYWFDSIILGQIVLAHCDMEAEGEITKLLYFFYLFTDEFINLFVFYTVINLSVGECPRHKVVVTKYTRCRKR